MSCFCCIFEHRSHRGSIESEADILFSPSTPNSEHCRSRSPDPFPPATPSTRSSTSSLSYSPDLDFPLTPISNRYRHTTPEWRSVNTKPLFPCTVHTLSTSFCALNEMWCFLFQVSWCIGCPTPHSRFALLASGVAHGACVSGRGCHTHPPSPPPHVLSALLDESKRTTMVFFFSN